MFKNNNFLLGILTGTIFPAVTWLIFNYWHKDWVLLNKPIVPYLVAVLINLLLIRTFHKHNAEKTTRGIMLITFVFLIIVFLIKIKI